MSNDAVIAALEAGLSAKPNDVNLILHLADLLLKDGQDLHKAFELAQKAVSLAPANVPALELAHKLAQKLDETEAAAGYATVLNALAGGTPAAMSERKNEPSEPEANDQKRVRGAKLRLVTEEDAAADFVEVEDSHIYLDDVGGMEEVKKRLRLSFLAPLQNPELMRAYGKSVRGGLLLYGPPGCGKTYIARALAGELGAKFINIGLTDILNMYIGESERRLHELFETARRSAPAVLFIDELDALGQKRSQLKSSGLRTLVNQLLTELDSMEQNNNDLFVLAATNHPWDVDSALRRPGRFDRVVAVFPPDQGAREAILQSHLKNKPVADIDLSELAKATHLYSGADLAHICNSAVEYALESSIESGQVRPIAQQDLHKALKEVKPSTLAWFESARNFAMFANDNGSYDDLLHFIQRNKL